MPPPQSLQREDNSAIIIHSVFKTNFFYKLDTSVYWARKYFWLLRLRVVIYEKDAANLCVCFVVKFTWHFWGTWSRIWATELVMAKSFFSQVFPQFAWKCKNSGTFHGKSPQSSEFANHFLPTFKCTFTIINARCFLFLFWKKNEIKFLKKLNLAVWVWDKDVSVDIEI